MKDVLEVLVSWQMSDRGVTREKASPSGRPRPGPGNRSILMLLGVLTLTSCFDQVLIPDVETDGRLTVTNDEEALSERLTYVEVEIPIEPVSPALFGAPLFRLIEQSTSRPHLWCGELRQPHPQPFLIWHR